MDISGPHESASSKELQAIQELFRQVRSYILEQAGKQAYSTKADGSPVTAVDIEVERIVAEGMKQQFPSVPVYGEETGYDKLPDVCWLIDPIDGTSDFIQNVPRFVCMAVRIAHGTATCSVIYNPSTDDMYVAEAGKGTYKNGARLDLHAMPVPPMAWCKKQFIGDLDELLEATGTRCEQAPPSGGYGFSMVAEGKVAARFNMRSGGYTHDYAPGALLVHEAGGAILSIADDEYSYQTRSFVACHPGLESVLRPELGRLRMLERTL